jgi:hypothetical protein
MRKIPDPVGGTEGGYLLVAAGFVVLALGGMVAGLAFDDWRSARYQANYMMGQQFAEAAIVAHNNAQRNFYANSIDFNVTPDVMTPVTTRVNGIEYNVRAIGVPAAPFDTSFQAASAILYLHPITTSGQQPLATDIAAFTDGAASRGAKDVAVVGAVIPPNGQDCGGEVTAVRWGALDDSNAAKCIPQNAFNDLTAVAGITPQPGDILIPVWEVALARMDTRALMRYPQPGREDLTQMTAPLTIGSGIEITNVGHIEAANLAVTDQIDMQNIAASGTSTMNMVTTSEATLNNGVTQNNDDGGGQTVIGGNVNAPEISINNDAGSGESRIIVSNAEVAEPITTPGLVLSGMEDGPLQLTATQISATDTDMIVNGNIAVQSASATSCTGASCPDVPPVE